MDWSFDWLLFGAAAFALAVTALIRAGKGKEKGWELLHFSSLACGVLALLAEYRAAARWAEHGDFAALGDVLPTMAGHLTAAVLLGLGINLLALLLRLARKKDGTER